METANENYLCEVAHLYALKKNDYARRFGVNWYLDEKVKSEFDKEMRKVTRSLRK